MLSPTQYHRIYRLSAWYDLLITWPYATPLTLAYMWQVLDLAHSGLGLPPLPVLDTYAVLFANFFGSVVLIWSLLRLRLDEPQLARWDAVARWLFSAWMAYALWQGASPLIAVFLFLELGFAVLQSLPSHRQSNPVATV